MLPSCRTRHGRYIYVRSQLSVTIYLFIMTPTMQYGATLQHGEFYGGGLTQLLETHHTHACDGDQVTITCPKRTVISIQYAKYGRSMSSSLICPRTTHSPTFRDLIFFEDSPLIENTNCIAVRSLEIMLDLCEDRPNCMVRASPETFTQDPCVGTFKYLEAHYKCRPNEFERQTVCEGEELHITCGHGQRLVVYSAMFGRTPNGTDKCRANKRGYIDCQSTGALSEVNTHCRGRRSCTILASESVFGDPCASGIKKYLTVSYACVPKKILKRLQQKTNSKKKKRKKKKKKGQNEDKTYMTTETDSSDVPLTTPVDGQILQSSPVEVYETYERMSVFQKLPESDSKSNESSTFLSLDGSSTEREDITTIQDQAIMSEDELYLPDTTHRQQFKHYKDGISDTTESSVSVNALRKSNKDMSAEYNTGDHNDNKENDLWNLHDTHIGKESDSVRNVDNQPSNQKSDRINNSHSGHKSSKDHLGHIKVNSLGADPTKNPLTLNATFNYASRNKAKGQGSRTTIYPGIHNPKSAKGNNVPESPYVTERNLTVLCMNQTKPDVRWGGMIRPRDERTIGFLRDWFSVVYFLQMHQEKAWLYFTLGICFGIIVMLIVVLIKVCINFHRNIHARLDVSEPTHRSAHTNNHSSLDAPMLEHSDSIDRIEIVRFSPRSTLHSHRSNSHHRDLVNYYG